MDINKISFESFREQIVDCFKLKDDLGSFLLSPDEINEVFEKSNKNLLWKRVPDWGKLECGDKDISDEDFINIMLKGQCKRKGSLYIITDQCFNNRMAYFVESLDIEEFIKTEYFKLHQMCFFQPEDIIFFNPDEKYLSVLHHSGLVGYFSD